MTETPMRDLPTLTLPGDEAPAAPLLADYLAGLKDVPEGLTAILTAIAGAVPALGARLAAGLLPGDPARIVGTNDSGDKQKALDVGAHEHVMAALRAAPVRLVLSEEAEEIATLDPDAAYDIAMDPIDGSGSIGIGAPLGLLFCVFPAAPEGFLRTGRSVIAAGYVSFGHSVDLGFSFGQGLDIATFDATAGAFRVHAPGVTLKPKTSTIAYNASNARHWGAGIRDYITDIERGKDGPRGRDFNMRWLGAAVGDMHRILLQGGLFLYPADARKGYEKGRLRLLYEAFPMAYIVEQAGGRATDGTTAILDILPTEPHGHCPLIFGSSEEVEALMGYMSKG
ncbi:class 1 fructose-bisphosphatase [Frigidibacter sp. MR17.14]|uniref:class 1 fructose-bisphosphatase n=1 Tax=Frigidibacter sp. MR17.14 TaxID=3126509 RepID=UPI003012A6C4